MCVCVCVRAHARVCMCMCDIRMLVSFWTNSRSSIIHSCYCTTTYNPSHKRFKLDEQSVLVTAGKVRTHSLVTLSFEPLFMNTPAWLSSQNIHLSTLWLFHERSPIGTHGKRNSRGFMRLARLEYHEMFKEYSSFFIMKLKPTPSDNSV